MCTTSNDCTGTKVCDLGVCWGSPPDTKRFAVVLMPPADRPDLAPTEIRDIQIDQDGTMRGLEFAETIHLHGRILGSICEKRKTELSSCKAALIPAQVIVERESTFPGGPVFRRSVLTNTAANENEDSFSISLPRDGQKYRVTILPNESLTTTPPLLTPPFSIRLIANKDQHVTWEIGDPNQLKTIVGCITTATGNGEAYQGMHVSALGQWDSEEKQTRASSIVTTDSKGCFVLHVPIAMLDTFDIIAKPGPSLTLPTLKLIGEQVPDPIDSKHTIHRIAPLVMPNSAHPTLFKLPLVGITSGGVQEGVPGATLTISTHFQKQSSEQRNIKISFNSKSVSQENGQHEGIVEIELYPGSINQNRSYQFNLLTPENSPYASIYKGSMEVGAGNTATVLETLKLKNRIAVHGTLLRYDSTPLSDTPLRVRPSPILRTALQTPFEKNTLDNLLFSTTISNDNGEFSVWLDPEVLGVTALYDFDLSPPDFSQAPRWSFSQISLTEFDNNLSTIDLGSFSFPQASYARGDIRDSDGHLVHNAEMRWYEVLETGNCFDTQCSKKARQMGIWESDENGKIVAVLPIPNY